MLGLLSSGPLFCGVLVTVEPFQSLSLFGPNLCTQYLSDDTMHLSKPHTIYLLANTCKQDFKINSSIFKIKGSR